MLIDDLKNIVRGEVSADDVTRKRYSRDASLFEVTPEVVVSPRDAEDVKRVVKYVAGHKSTMPNLSVTGRSAGTDMTGGPLTESIVLEFTTHMNHMREVGEGHATAEPGMFYRDFEKETLKYGCILPSYPASRELCAMGGIVNNNSGGEKSLVYGKTERYVAELKIVLADGNEYAVKPLTKGELDEKMKEQTFEGEVYRKLYKLITDNYELITSAKPHVSKNSSGYNLWNVWNGTTFDLPKLIVGSQGTFGMLTEATFRLVKTLPKSGMAVLFLKNATPLADIVNRVLPLKPASFEIFDDHTLTLALKFFTGFLKSLGAKNLFSLALKFVPDLFFILTHGMPKFILLVEFEEETQAAVDGQLAALHAALAGLPAGVRFTRTKEESAKYWAIRRESFNLLRQKVKDKQTAPFIDDLVVAPEKLPEFLPKLYAILDRYKLLYTIAGHIGDGNFHVIPLMNLAHEEERAKIPKAADEVFNLVLSYGGVLTGEHNDGLIRSPYLEKAYGSAVYKLFEETKRIFDPRNIFNPGKKVGATLAFALEHMKRG